MGIILNTNVSPPTLKAPIGYRQSRVGLGEAQALGSAILAEWFWVKVGLSEHFPHLHCRNHEIHSGASAETWWVTAARGQG